MEDRLRVFIESLNTSTNAFEKSIGVGTGTIAKTIAGKKSLGSDVLKKIITEHPELNLNWLFYGKEDMLNFNWTFPRSQNEKIQIKTTNDTTNDLQDSILSEPNEGFRAMEVKVRELEGQVERLQMELQYTQQLLHERTERILELKERILELKSQISVQTPEIAH